MFDLAMEPEIIDSHQHFWQVGRFDYPWMSPEIAVLYRDYLPPQLEPILKAAGVTSTVLVQASNSIAESRWLLELADQYSFIAGIVGWVDLTSDDVVQQLDELTAHPKFKGVRHLVESEPADDWLVQPRVLRGLHTLATYGVAYDLLLHPRHLKHARTVAESCPELRLVVDHLAKPPIASGEIKEWAADIRSLAAYPNVWCKLSGLVTEADWSSWKTADLKPYVDTALESFGPERMMFGSDHPVCLLTASYARVLDSFAELLADLSDDERSSVFSRNAIEFYRLWVVA
jgi:L-fuconolactonase